MKILALIFSKLYQIKKFKVMKTLTHPIAKFTIEPVKRRERLLIEIYQLNSYGAYSFERSMKKERASRLLKELRTKCDALPKWRNVTYSEGTTAAHISGNGKYSLD